jgi:nucleotide-binding universal stress UspA family protein
VLVGYDRSPSAAAALEIGAEMAVRLRAGHLHVLHAVTLEDYPTDPDIPDWEARAQAVLEEERERVRAALAWVPLPWSYYCVRHDPARRLLDLAEQTDALMIVVGDHRHGLEAAMHRLLRGWVADGLLRHGNRPVLVVPNRPTTSTVH